LYDLILDVACVKQSKTSGNLVKVSECEKFWSVLGQCMDME